ncbi:MAG: hypothetical protein OXT09_11800, partial [Myxococcales bacterium]|nr:hypothetical protein [Myxococcales bacterium]
VLGVSTVLPFDSGFNRPPLPRNVAFVMRGGEPLDARGEDGRLELEPLGLRARNLELVAPPEPLDAGSVLSVDGESFVVGEVLDERAPDAPVLMDGAMRAHDGETGCATDSCGDFATVSFALSPPSDNHSPPGNLVYAIYFGRDPAGARSASEPVALVPRDGGEIFSFVDFGWGEGDVYATVTALDMAGNESERSAVMKVYDEGGPCAVAGSRGGLSTLGWVMLALLLIARRRRTR